MAENRELQSGKLGTGSPVQSFPRAFAFSLGSLSNLEPRSPVDEADSDIWSMLLPVKFVLRSVFSIGDNLPVNLGKTVAQESIKSTCCWQALLKNAIAPNVTLRCQFHKIQHGEKFDHLKNRKSHVLYLAGRMLIWQACSTTMMVHKISFYHYPCTANT